MRSTYVFETTDVNVKDIPIISSEGNKSISQDHPLDSFRRGSTVTLDHKIDINLKKNEENVAKVDSIYSQLLSLNKGIEKVFDLTDEVKVSVVNDIDKFQYERKIEAKAYLFWPILVIVSLIGLIISMYSNAKNGAFLSSLFGILLILSLVYTGINFKELLIIINKIEEFSIIYNIIN